MKRIRAMAPDAAVYTIAVCAVVMTAIVVRREFFARPAARAAVPQTPVAVNDWDRVRSAGRRFGPSAAPVTIVEFSDFECPFCRAFTLGPLSAIRRQFGDQVTVLYRHWPLARIHRFAYPAARAAECAGAQGRFAEFHDLIFAKQDSLGLKSFSDFARESGVSNMQAFARCHATTDPVPAIEADIAEAERMGAQGTPTVVVNGMLWPIPPDSAALATIISGILTENVSR
jgi:protein-disulfide isomerase